MKRIQSLFKRCGCFCWVCSRDVGAFAGSPYLISRSSSEGDNCIQKEHGDLFLSDYLIVQYMLSYFDQPTYKEKKEDI